MARRLNGPHARPGAGLRPRRRHALAWIAGLVVVLHLAVLAWLASLWRPASVIQPLPPPVFTRQIALAPPAAAPAKPKPATRAQAESATAESVPELPGAGAASPPAPAASATHPAPAPPPVEAAAVPATAAASAPAPVPADSWPPDTRLSYRLGGNFRGELHGEAHVQWQRAGSQYQAQVEIGIGWLVKATLTSQGRVAADGLRPQAYEEHLRGARRSVLLDDAGITLRDGRRVARPEGVQDTASQFVELAHRFASGRSALVVGQPVTLWLARPGGVDLWTYDVTEKVVLDTPHFGAVETFHLKPRPLEHPRGPMSADIWFAPGLQYLPVRIRIQLGGDHFVDLLAERIEQR